MARIRKTARVIAAPSADQCRTFVQLRNFYKRTFGITLHTVDEEAVNAMLARKSPPGARQVVYVLEAIKEPVEQLTERWYTPAGISRAPLSLSRCT